MVKVCDVPVEVLTCTSRPRIVSTTSHVVGSLSRVTDLTVAPAGNVCPIVSVQPADGETWPGLGDVRHNRTVTGRYVGVDAQEVMDHRPLDPIRRPRLNEHPPLPEVHERIVL